MMIYIHRSNYVYNDIYPLYTKVVMFTMIYIHRGDYIYTGQSTPLTPTGIYCPPGERCPTNPEFPPLPKNMTRN